MVNATKKDQRRNRSLADEIKRQTGQIAAINTVTTAVSQSLDLNVTLQTALEAVLSVIPVDSSGISMIDEAAGELVLRAQRGWRKDFVKATPMRIKLGQGLSGLAITNDEIVITGDPTNDPRMAVPAFLEEQIKAQLLAPMHAHGRVVGILSVMSHTPYQFDDDEIKIVRAIADQVGIALDNARLYESVREQQSRLQAILQSTADVIIAVDSAGKINLMNQAARTLFTLDVDALIGRHLRDTTLPSVLVDELCQTIDSSATAPHAFEVLLDNGRFLAGVTTPVYMQAQLNEQRSEGWVAVLQDITHMKEAERARWQFFQTAAHDLRNPLGVTLSALTMLHKNWKNPTSTEQEVFNIAITGIDRMQALIDDLLNLERIESGVDFNHDQIIIPELVERCAIEMTPVLQQREQTLQLAVDRALPPFYGDENWLYRALVNLISNAHKYTQMGSTITIRAEKRGADLALQVEDNGPGIPLEAQARLFQRFYRVPDKEKKIQGTGLGLAIVKSVAEKHDGQASVASQPGQGSTFAMIMPFRERLVSITNN